MQVAARTLDARLLFQQLSQLGPQQANIYPGMSKQRPYRTALLIQQRQHQMHGFDKLMLAANCKRLGIAQSILKLAGKSIHSHR